MSSIFSTQVAECLPYDNALSGLDSDQVQGAIDELSARSAGTPFSLRLITKPSLVPDGSQMLYALSLEIDSDLTLDGDAVEMADSGTACLPDYMISSESVRHVIDGKRMFFCEPFDVDGTLVIDGELREISE